MSRRMLLSASLALALLASAGVQRAEALQIAGSGTNTSFTGTLDVVTNPANTTTATILVTLNNTSPYDARITGFGFEVPPPSVVNNNGVTLTVDSGTLASNKWSGELNVNAPNPFTGKNRVDVAGITGPNLGGGTADFGIPNEDNDLDDDANPASFTLVLTGTNLHLLTASAILDNAATPGGFYVRFQRVGLNDGSDLVRAQVNSVPEPSTYAFVLSGLAAAGLMGLRRRRRS